MVPKALILRGDLGITGQTGELSTADRPLHRLCFSQTPGLLCDQQFKI